MHDITQLRPKETGIYCSKPGFRRMHQLIGHAGICRRLDCWREHAKKKNSHYTDLETFAASMPTLDNLQEMADDLVHTYTANHQLHRMRRRPAKERDSQFENALLLNKYFLLNVHFVYPEGLKRAVRYHILVNPTGKEKKWCAVDWCVELNNLFTKAQQVKNGGKVSNHTVERILLESPLVQVYRNIQTLIQKNFDHTHLSSKHGDVDMAKSFKKLCN
ncbi:hypothetical protein PAXRUDRAFT_786856 [Paxillus rubicundulus Ve08.2h10]|uniref:DUF6589 domain-containing protein n=1 Tax=Paxillus rubicundulus Ve08.2h10 TaxID=930991 RepID=A0A0D0DD10_9AGAM|nr:hypothetical protein PAXRUDRAFT_786856 [Paxillus rubicundulus Ve08.2h10]